MFKPFKHFHLLKKVGRKEVRAVVQQMMLILTCKRTRASREVQGGFEASEDFEGGLKCFEGGFKALESFEDCLEGFEADFEAFELGWSLRSL